MNPFPDIFYLAAALGFVAASLAVFVPRDSYRYASVAVLAVPLVVVYLLGMYRSYGIDYENYEAYLGSGRRNIPDVGYRLLMDVAHAIGLTLPEFFLCQGLFTLCAVFVLARKLNSDPVVTIAIYVLHAAIVRDFSQSRTALALAFFFFALVQERKSLYALLTVAAVSVHLTLVPLVFVYHWVRFVLNRQRGQVFLAFAPAAAMVVGMAVVLPMIKAFDPRIEIYMNWSEDLYGNPVSSYSTLLLFLLLAAIAYRAYQLTGDRTSKMFVVMLVYAAATFVAFRDLAIFAFRLSNVVAALYPFAVGRAIYLIKEREQNRLFDYAVPLGLLAALLLAVLGRHASYEVLEITKSVLLAH